MRLKKKNLLLLLLSLFISTGCVFIESKETEEAQAEEQTEDKKEIPEHVRKKTGIPKGWELIPGDMVKISMGTGGENPLVVALDAKGGAFQLTQDWKTWKPLPTKGSSVVRGQMNTTQGLKFMDICIAPDGTVGAIDNQKKQAWILDGERWNLTTPRGDLQAISVGSKNEVCVTNRHSQLFRKRNPVIGHPHWERLPGKTNNLSCNAAGNIYHTGINQIMYSLMRHNRRHTGVVRPASIGLGTPLRIKMADDLTLAFIDYQGRIWIRKPNTSGKERDHWYEAPGAPRCKDFGIGIDGSLIVISTKNKIMYYKPNKTDQEKNLAARGAPLRGNGLVSIKTGLEDAHRKLWTHAGSVYDPHNRAAAPHNHIEILVGATHTYDYRDDIGNFFMITKADKPDSNEPIKYGEPINIWSCYAVKGYPGKAGALSKEWKWWSHKHHFKWGTNYRDIVVSLVSHNQTKDGSEKFMLVSPSGRTGNVHSNDMVEVFSIAPHSKNRRMWTHTWNRWGGYYHELLIPATHHEDHWGYHHYRGGRRNLAGFQIFDIKAINDVDDIPPTPYYRNQKPKKGYWGFPDNKSAQDIYAQIEGSYYKTAKIKKRVDKVRLKANHKEGIGVFKEIRNKTTFPLKVDNTDIPPQDSLQGLNRELFANLSVKGFSEETQPFGPEKMIQLERLWSEGMAWVTESLSTPGQTCVSFLVRGKDKGNAQVVFGNKIEPKCLWKVIIGADENKRSYILRGNRVMAEADAKITPFARLAPGRFLPYYVSINKNESGKSQVIVGFGVPGDNIFLSCIIPNNDHIDRVGFSCHEDGVDFTEVNFTPPLVMHGPDSEYGKQEDVVNLPEKAGEKIDLKQELRVPNEGTVSFDVQAQSDVTFLLENDKGEAYRVVLGANSNKELQLYRGEHQATIVKTMAVPFARLTQDKAKRFYVSINGGTFVIGQGNPGERSMAVWQDQNAFKNVRFISFVAANHEQKISNVTYAPPVSIGTKERKHSYEKPLKRFPYKGSIKLLRFFHWDFAQDGQRVATKDLVTGQSFHVIGTPQQGARYSLMMTVQPDGTPQIIQTEGPKESPAKIALKRRAALARIKGDELKDAAEGTRLAAEATGAWAGGVGTGSKIMAGVGALSVAASAVLHGIGAKKTADAARLELREKMGYRAHDSPVYTDLVQMAKGMRGVIPEAAKANRKLITDLLWEARFLSFGKEKDYKKLVSIYLEILRRVSHPYVIEDPATKENIYDALEEFNDSFEPYPLYYDKIMTMFLKAFSNDYLVDKNKRTESLAKDRWYGVQLDIASHLFNQCMSKENFAVEVDALYGEYLWLPVEMVKDGKLMLSFEARGANDALVCFAQEDYKVKELDNDIYEVALGSWENTRHELRIRSLGKPAVQVFKKDSEFSNTMLNPRRFKEYWVEMDLSDNGFMIIGTVEGGQDKVLLEWEDPFPWKNIRFIGFGSWNAPVEFRNILINGVQDIGGTAELQDKPDVERNEFDDEEEELLDEEEG